MKPSPFCILDEVDAPLDDANVDRFTRILRKFSDNTQFIVVTHNKRTMEAASALYGVTMEEEGVSKLVTVRFNEGAQVQSARWRRRDDAAPVCSWTSTARSRGGRGEYLLPHVRAGLRATSSWPLPCGRDRRP